MAVSDAPYNTRQLARRALADYRVGAISLRRLIGALDTIWDFLEPSEREEEFRRHWATLDVAYAVAVDRGQLDDMPNDMVSDIERSIQGLESLLSADTND